MATGKWMIYGANGYTGELCAREAKRRGMAPLLAGRRTDAIDPLARELGFDSAIFNLDVPDAVAEHLREIDVVLHCAGPFSATSRPMLDACVKGGAHYTDITGEIDVFEHVHTNADAWKDGGIVAMPGVGFDVVPTDCTAAMLKREMPDATHLRLAFKSEGGTFSPGTTKTMIEGMPEGGKVREAGVIRSVPPAYKVCEIPFADKSSLALTIPWGDVSTAYYSTGIPNIECYLAGSRKQVDQLKRLSKIGPIFGIPPVQALMKWIVEKTVKGPTEKERETGQTQVWGEVTNEAGDRAAMTMQTPESYKLTVLSSLAAVEKLLDDPPAEGGAYTPSMAFGADFVTELEGVSVQPVVRESD